MPDVTLETTIPLPPEKAFDVYVEQMDVWWPRQGVFPYSFAPKSTRPQHIRFEARLGGRYFETFADGSEYVIGRITGWDPSARLIYTWRDPTWPDETVISLHFAEDGNGTRLNYEQHGFAQAGVAGLIPYYQIGCGQTLAAYIAHCRAISALKALELSQD